MNVLAMHHIAEGALEFGNSFVTLWPKLYEDIEVTWSLEDVEHLFNDSVRPLRRGYSVPGKLY